MMNVIAVDIGNSSINIGIFHANGLFTQKMDSFPLRHAEDYREVVQKILQENHIENETAGVIISSVVPGHDTVLSRALRGCTQKEPLVVNYRMNTGLTFAVPHPETLGSDRIANAVAAYDACRGPAAVTDFGTATAVSIVGEKGVFLGGAILPGMGLMNKALAQGASQLSDIPFDIPASALGKDTTSCIAAGLFFGTAGAVERLLDEIEKEIGCRVQSISTGGYAPFVSPLMRKGTRHLPDLTLAGLKILYLRNMNA
jgi:type III pantothenate kinase